MPLAKSCFVNCAPVIPVIRYPVIFFTGVLMLYVSIQLWLHAAKLYYRRWRNRRGGKP